jgi:hypothetical protein
MVFAYSRCWFPLTRIAIYYIIVLDVPMEALM